MCFCCDCICLYDCYKCLDSYRWGDVFGSVVMGEGGRVGKWEKGIWGNGWVG